MHPIAATLCRHSSRGGKQSAIRPVAGSEAQPRSIGYDPLIPAIGFVLLAVMAWLYVTGSDLYGRILAYWTFIPWRHPFIDFAAIPSFIRCWQRHGLVVYTDAAWAACGVGPLIYSPLWLRLTFLPTDPAWTNWLGLSVVSAFLLSLGSLPQSRRSGDRGVTIVGTFSCLPVFAMERANIDLLVFLSVVAAAYCLEGGLGRRIVGYSLMLLGGLLKFYPLVLLVLMLRERLAVLAALGLTAAAIVAGTAFAFLDELRRLTAPPSGPPFYNLWGAGNLAGGFPTVLRAFMDAAGLPTWLFASQAQQRFIAAVVASLLLASMLVVALRFARRDDLAAGLTAISDRAHRLLLMGGVLVVGCFFAGQNVGYRGVFLLLILPGLLALARIPACRSLRPVLMVTIGAMLCVLWELTTRHVVADVFGGSFHPVGGSLAGYTVWLAQELAWWWLVTVLVAILMRFAADSQAWRELRSVLYKPSAANGGP